MFCSFILRDSEPGLDGSLKSDASMQKVSTVIAETMKINVVDLGA